MKATALTILRTQEGFEMRCAFTYSGKAPTPAKRRDAALAMLSEVNALASKTNASDGGFQANDAKQTGVGSVFVDGGTKHD